MKPRAPLTASNWTFRERRKARTNNLPHYLRIISKYITYLLVLSAYLLLHVCGWKLTSKWALGNLKASDDFHLLPKQNAPIVNQIFPYL